MKVLQNCWSEARGWDHELKPDSDVQLVLGFGSRQILDTCDFYQELDKSYPSAQIAFCSTAGEIHGDRVLDDTMCITTVSFDHVQVSSAAVQVSDSSESFLAGKELGSKLLKDDLSYVLVLSDGLNVNGSELAKGLAETLPENVIATGGLSGDADAFEKTMVGLNGPAVSNMVVAIGFYGDRLKVAHGSLGGWDPFGPDRLITRSDGNVLYELDGQSALSLYKEYLGDYAEDLPASGLLFPLLLHDQDEPGVVRTILGIDHEKNTMTFAGDMPEGSYTRLMKANFDRLVDGAVGAATRAKDMFAQSQLAILISCVGRKLVLQQRVEEEVEAVQDILGSGTAMAGFYSYGELSPLTPEGSCELHNQTMTITTLFEI